MINTGGKTCISNSRFTSLRRSTLINKVPYCTNMSTAYAFLEAIKSLKTKKMKSNLYKKFNLQLSNQF
ncbi:MAG: hypothetical protein CM1200mP5_3560 [Candidatus Pelagibacterales bacterium]|nr:MAG: hypothetical protein CM1200mP5_3560 [Pelagibacterales bacterium]